MNRERTLVLIKPDGVEKNLVGEIIRRFEKKGLYLAGMKLMRVSQEQALLHYQEHQGKSFFSDLIQYITSGPIVAMVWEGTGAVLAVRTLNGATHPLEAVCGTIRGDFGLEKERNLVHGSDGAESARREIDIFFAEHELFSR